MIIKLIWLSICISHFKAKEVLIRDLSAICYLEKTFKDNLNIFPEDLKIRIHLTRIPGLLFYSIDRHFNQLIVKIHDEFDPFLTVEFNRKKFLISLKKLCKCEGCMFEPLEFQFQLKNGINVICNEGEKINNKYSPYQHYKSRYPIPKFHKNISAYMWMINTPEFDNMGSKIYPENQFLTGCIFEVSHNNVSVEMAQFGAGLSNKCIKQCKDNVCNDGKCLETYESKPLCDCLRTYRNGDFCNSTHFITDMQNDGFQFEVLKISWKSYLKDILLLRNKNVLLSIEIQYKYLCLQYLETNLFEKHCLKIFQENYLYGHEYILILTLEDKFLDIQAKMHLSHSWIHIQFPINLAINKEVFHKIVFLNNSREETGEIVFKVSKKERKWRYIGSNVHNQNNPDNNYNSQTNGDVNKILHADISLENILAEQPFLYIIIGAGIGIVLTIIVVIIIVYKCPSCIPHNLRKRMQIPIKSLDITSLGNDVISRTNSIMRTNSIDTQKNNGTLRNTAYVLRGSTDILRNSNDGLRSSTDVLLRNNSVLRRSNDVLRRSNDILLPTNNKALYSSFNHVNQNRWSRIDI